MDHEFFRIIENKFPWTIINNEYIKLVSKMLTSEDTNDKKLTSENTNDKNQFVQFIKKHPNIYFKVIFDIEKFQEDCSIDSVGYILFDEKINQPVYFDINGINILQQRYLEMVCLGTNMDKQEYLLSDKWKFASKRESNEIKQKIAWLIFLSTVHNCNAFYIRVRRDIGMDYLHEFDENIVEKYRLVTLKENVNKMKRNYFTSFLFGKYNDIITKRLFFFQRENEKITSVKDEFESRAICCLYKNNETKKKIYYDGHQN